MRLSRITIVVATLLLYYTTRGQEQEHHSSICHSLRYRSLSLQQQNEHQCRVLEIIHNDFDQEKSMLRSQYQDLYTMISRFQTSMYRNVAALKTPSRDSAKSVPNLHDIPLVRDCSELYLHGITLSGVYPVRLPNRNIVNVWCDMTAGDGGWMTIQRRKDGTVNFTREWDDYAFGFGNVNSEYWLGNENLYWLSHYKNYSIRFELWDWEDNYAYALYDYFRVENEQKDYQLTIQGYSGTAGDAMYPYHNNMRFSTIDRDNDEWHSSCARKDQSGWWYKACGYASLNGVYMQNGDNQNDPSPDGVIKGILWSKWKKQYGYSMKKTEIKVKPRTHVKLDEENSKQDHTSTESAVTERVGTTTTAIENKSDATEVTDSDVKEKDAVTSTVSPETTTQYHSDDYDYDYDYYK